MEEHVSDDSVGAEEVLALEVRLELAEGVQIDHARSVRPRRASSGPVVNIPLRSEQEGPRAEPESAARGSGLSAAAARPAIPPQVRPELGVICTRLPVKTSRRLFCGGAAEASSQGRKAPPAGPCFIRFPVSVTARVTSGTSRPTQPPPCSSCTPATRSGPLRGTVTCSEKPPVFRINHFGESGTFGE